MSCFAIYVCWKAQWVSFEVADDDMIWEYDGFHTGYQGDCEELLIEMQRIFYEDLETQESLKGILYLSMMKCN